MAKKSKRPAKRTRKSAKPRDLAANNAKAVKGGRKQGEGQQEYLVYKLNDIIVTG
jgi:hypothetical protein